MDVCDIYAIISSRSICATIKITASPLKAFTVHLKIRLLLVPIPYTVLLYKSCTVIDDMRKVSTATAPRMKCSQSYFNLGNISLKKHIQRKVKVTNEGANPLIIRKIECPEFVFY